MAPDALLGLLAEPERMRAFAAVVLGARTPAEVVQQAGLTPREAAAALRRLVDGGVVGGGSDDLRAELGAFKEAMRGAGRRDEEPMDSDQTRAAVLRAFVVNGRIVSLPAQYAKRLVVLEHVAASFEPGVRYPEKEVNAVMRAWYDDYAALRRYLVDTDLLSREDGVYWRVGGPVNY